MKTVFEAGDLVRVKKDSWWLERSQTFRNMIAVDDIILVTDDIVKSQRFFYGVVCGGDGEAHLWSHEEFDLVQEAVK